MCIMYYIGQAVNTVLQVVLSEPVPQTTVKSKLVSIGQYDMC